MTTSHTIRVLQVLPNVAALFLLAFVLLHTRVVPLVRT